MCDCCLLAYVMQVSLGIANVSSPENEPEAPLCVVPDVVRPGCWWGGGLGAGFGLGGLVYEVMGAGCVRGSMSRRDLE